MDATETAQPSPSSNGGIMVFYPCAPDQLTADPRTNRMIMSAISQAGANLTRESSITPSGFALMVPNTLVDSYSDDPFRESEVESHLKHLVDRASGGDGPWVPSESKQTQWSPGDVGSRVVSLADALRYPRGCVDQTTEMSLDHFPFVTDRSTSTTPPKVCDKFTSCSPTPSIASTYPDSGVDDSKSVSCQDLVAGGETAFRAKRLSSADTLSTEEDRGEEDQTEEEEEDPFLSVNEILGASLVRSIPVYPFIEMSDKTTSTEEDPRIFPSWDFDFEEPYSASLRSRLVDVPRDEYSLLAQSGSATSLDDYHSPVDSEDKDGACIHEEGFFCRDVNTDTEDLAWMISIAVGTPDKDGDEFAGQTEEERLTASPPLPFKKGVRVGPDRSLSGTDVTVQTIPSSGICRSSQVSPNRFETAFDYESSTRESIVREVVSCLVETVAQEEVDRYPKIWSLEKASNTDGMPMDELDFAKPKVLPLPKTTLTFCIQESVHIPSVKKANKKCQIEETKPLLNRENLVICPQESVNVFSIKKVNKKQMTEQWVQSQCDAFSSVSPQDLTPLSLSPVCVEEFLPDEVLVREEMFLTANESTLAGLESADDGPIRKETMPALGHAKPTFQDATTEYFVCEKTDREVQVGVETKDVFTKMKKQKVRCVETNTDDLPEDPDPRIFELETKLADCGVAIREKDLYIAQLEEQLRAVSEAESERFVTISRLEESLADSVKDKIDAEDKFAAQKDQVEALLDKVGQLSSFYEAQEEDWRYKYATMVEEKRSLDETLGSSIQAVKELEEEMCRRECETEELRLLGKTEEIDEKEKNNNSCCLSVDENCNKHSVFLASRIVDELVNVAFKECDFPKWTAEKIVTDLLSSAIVERKRESADAVVETERVKTKSRKSNTDAKEFVDSGCDPVEELGVSLNMVDAACNTLEIELGVATVQASIKMVDKFTHMEVQKSRSISTLTNEIESVDASTLTCAQLVHCATQAEVTTKDKGTSCKVKKSKSKETMTCETETADRWTSMSSLTQVKDKSVSVSLKAHTKSVSTSVSVDDVTECSEMGTMTEIPMAEEASQVDFELSLLLGVESFTQYEPDDIGASCDAAATSTIFTADAGTQFDAIETADKAMATKKIKHKDAASETDGQRYWEFASTEVAVNTDTVASTEVAVNTDLLLVEYRVDQAVGPDVETALRNADAVTSMESIVFTDEKFSEVEKKEFADKDTQVKKMKMKGKSTMTESDVSAAAKETTMGSRVDICHQYTSMGSAVEVTDQQTSMDHDAISKSPEELMVAVETCVPLQQTLPAEGLLLRQESPIGRSSSSSTLPTCPFAGSNDALSSTVADEDVSFHTCHQHSPTIVEDPIEVKLTKGLQLHSAQQIVFSPSPILVPIDCRDAITDTDDLETFVNLRCEEEYIEPKMTASTAAASPRRSSQLVKRLMAPTVSSSSKRRSPKPKRKGGRGKRDVNSPLIVKGIKPSDRPAHFPTASGSSSSPDEASPDIHQGFKTVMKELKKRMSDAQLPDDDPIIDAKADESPGDADGEQIHTPRVEAARKCFRLPVDMSALSSSTPSKIPTPKSAATSIARRRRSPEFDAAAVAAMPNRAGEELGFAATMPRGAKEEVYNQRDLDWGSGVTTRRRYVGIVRPSRSMETVQEDTIIPRVSADDRLNRTAPGASQSNSLLQRQIQAEISRRESRRLTRGGETAPPKTRVSTETTMTITEDPTKLDLGHLGGEIQSVGEEGGELVGGLGDAISVDSPAGSEEDRRLSARSRESKDLEWENEWELAYQSPRPGHLVGSSSLDALTVDLGFSVHSFNDSNTDFDVSRFEYLEHKIDLLKDAITRRDATLREYRTELEERDLHVDHCNQMLQETQSRYSKLVQENGGLKSEMEKLERVMLMQDEQIVALNMDKNHLTHEIEYKESEHQEVYKFLDDEKRILEEEKKNLERDKKDLEAALRTAQEELKTISDNMRVEDDQIDKQRLINVLEGAGSELDNLGEQVAAEQVLKQQLATENKTLKDLLDQARRHSLESIGKIETMEKVLRDRKECRLSLEKTDPVHFQEVESECFPQEASALRILEDLLAVAGELKAELLKTPSSCPNSPIYPSKGNSTDRKSTAQAESGDASSHNRQMRLSSWSTRPSLLQDMSRLHDDLFELKSLLLIYKKEAQDAIGDLVSSNIQLIDEQYAQGNTVAKRVEFEKAQEIESLKKDLKEAHKQVKLGKSQINTFTRSMKKQDERIKDLEDQNRAFELQIALSRDEGRRDSNAFASFPREDCSTLDDSNYQESKRLRKEYWRLISKQISDKEHYDRLFGKLTRRMQVLEDNWRKADDEVVLLDGLVQHIRFALMTHLDTIKGCDSLFAMLQELNAVVEAAGGDVNCAKRMDLGSASSPADTISTIPTSSQSS